MVEEDYLESNFIEDEDTEVRPTENPSALISELKKMIHFKDDEWLNLALDLLIGKFLMDYDALCYDQEKNLFATHKSKFYYSIGELIVKFVDRREKDVKLFSDANFKFKQNDLINIITNYLASKNKQKEIKMGARAIRYFCELYKEYDFEELDPEISPNFYSELRAMANNLGFSNTNSKKAFRRRIAELQKKYSFSNYFLRVIYDLIQEEPDKRANGEYFEDVYLIIKDMPKFKIEDALIEAKKKIERHRKNVLKLDQFLR